MARPININHVHMTYMMLNSIFIQIINHIHHNDINNKISSRAIHGIV